MANMNTDTIAAIATPKGQGGIGIIRISGPRALKIAQTLFRTKSKRSRPKDDRAATLNPGQGHRLIYGTLIDPAAQQTLDEVLAVYMPAPHSYTCEDVVEFQTHGGPIILDKVIRLICNNGARPAHPGEFTQRAFLNGRIDLTQAEAVADMIAASSERASQLAAQQLDGRLNTTLRSLIEELTELLADMEACIEFPDDIGEPYDRSYLSSQLTRKLIDPIGRLIQSYAIGRIIHDGLRLAIVGRPNVGKSSLLNALLQYDRAIVTEFPGTTRDTIEAHFAIEGFPVVLIDTAGLRSSNDPVESLGMQKTEATIQTADLVLLVVDATRIGHPQDISIFNQIGDAQVHLVINKIDLISDSQSLQVPPPFNTLQTSTISALHGTAIEQLKTAIGHRCFDQPSPSDESVTITSARHQTALQDAFDILSRSNHALTHNVPEDIVAIDMHQALSLLRQITGDTFDQDLLDTIFKRFCIGK